eukprot:6475362-Pyramimonas_sp.AAC.1
MPPAPPVRREPLRGAAAARASADRLAQRVRREVVEVESRACHREPRAACRQERAVAAGGRGEGDAGTRL